MLKLEGIRATPFQIFRTPIDDGTITFKMEYKPAVQMWFINVEFGDYIINGLRVCHNLNLLQQYKNLIPFGLLCNANTGIEPIAIDDFSAEKMILYVLSQSEVDSLDDYYKANRIL